MQANTGTWLSTLESPEVRKPWWDGFVYPAFLKFLLRPGVGNAPPYPGPATGSAHNTDHTAGHGDPDHGGKASLSRRLHWISAACHKRRPPSAPGLHWATGSSDSPGQQHRHARTAHSALIRTGAAPVPSAAVKLFA